MCEFAYHQMQDNGSDLPMTLFEALDQRRLDAKISRKELCDRAGIWPASYSKWARGVEGITARSLEQLQKALDALIGETA